VPELIVERHGGVVTATINRPARKNALTYELFDALGALFGEVDARHEDRCLVLRGAGGDFCSGIDLSVLAESRATTEAVPTMARINATALALHDLRTPTIAAVDGLAVGAGMSLALGCDLVIASSAARFCAIFVRRGLSIDFGLSWLLPRLVGAARARELCLLGEMLDATSARAMGLVSDVVDPGALDERVAALAATLASGPSVAIAEDLALLDASYARSFAEALDAEAASQDVAGSSDDAREAIGAFLEKRPARFTGR